MSKKMVEHVRGLFMSFAHDQLFTSHFSFPSPLGVGAGVGVCVGVCGYFLFAWRARQSASTFAFRALRTSICLLKLFLCEMI
jgi:hypothetical protein